VRPTVAAPAISRKSALNSVRGALPNVARTRLFRRSGNKNRAALIGRNGARKGEDIDVLVELSTGVWIVRLTVDEPPPEAIVAGEKTAVAADGRPEAVNVTGKAKVPPSACKAKV
jgi:hypothetical protein